MKQDELGTFSNMGLGLFRSTTHAHELDMLIVSCDV